MRSQEKDDLLPHFAKMKAAYAALLGSVHLDEYQDALQVLRLPLEDLFCNTYLEFHPRRELADVDQVEFLGGFFLLDSQGRYSNEAASRVVGALGVSQESLTLRELLSRLRVEKDHAGRSREQTLESIRTVLWGALDTASSKKRRCLVKAISTALGVERKGLVQVVEEIEAGSSYRSPLSQRSANHLRDLACLLCESLPSDSAAAKIPLPRKGQLLPDAFWGRLRDLVQFADQSLSESRKTALLGMLVGFYAPGYKELLKNLQSPTEELLERVEEYVCPIVESRKRPRNNLAQKRMRFNNNTKYQYDIGHFLPHSAGGPTDINLFIQERRLNRGWSEQGKIYRWLENMVFSHPGRFFFVRPVYSDLSLIPVYLEWGALLDETLLQELGDNLKRSPNLHLVGPLEGMPSGQRLAWLVAVFDNFDADAIREMRISSGWTAGL